MNLPFARVHGVLDELAPHPARLDQRAVAPVAPGLRIPRRALLLCGAFSLALYVAADLFGGLRYPGYSFSSQAVSELMAIDAPSESLVDPLFILSGLVAIVFGLGVLREAGRNRALRITAVLLTAYAMLGLSGPTLFEMHQRGSPTQGNDLPHIVVTGVLVLLLLGALGAGAMALGKRFRVYSLATLLVAIAFGALSIPYGARLATGQPTPGFGIIERIDIYSLLVWIAVLGVALLRRLPADGFTMSPASGHQHSLAGR